MKPLSEREIESASEYLLGTGIVKKTEIQRYSELYNDVDLYIKREDLQDVGSFKIRGAFNAISILSDEEKLKGVSCASAGNHAQGFAIACSHFQVRGTVFMPIAAPNVKVDATKKFGGEYIDVQLVGDNFDETKAEAEAFNKKNSSTFIHPFDDSGVIIGTSTIGYEIFQQMEEIEKEVDYILVPVGGGGLIAGIIEAKNIYSPNTEVIGVEPFGHRSMLRSRNAGEVVTLENPDSTKFADGTAVARVGDKTFEIVHKNNTKILTVRAELLAKHLEFMQEKNAIILEPSGVLSVAGVRSGIDTFVGKVVVSILSGANIDETRVSRIPILSGRHDEDRINEGKSPIFQ